MQTSHTSPFTTTSIKGEYFFLLLLFRIIVFYNKSTIKLLMEVGYISLFLVDESFTLYRQ